MTEEVKNYRRFDKSCAHCVYLKDFEFSSGEYCCARSNKPLFTWPTNFYDSWFFTCDRFKRKWKPIDRTKNGWEKDLKPIEIGPSKRKLLPVKNFRLFNRACAFCKYLDGRREPCEWHFEFRCIKVQYGPLYPWSFGWWYYRFFHTCDEFKREIKILSDDPFHELRRQRLIKRDRYGDPIILKES